MFSTESLDKLDVHWFITVVGKNTQVGLALVKCLGTLVQPSCKSIIYQGGFQHFLDSSINVHRTSCYAGNIISFRISHSFLLRTSSMIFQRHMFDGNGSPH